MTRVIVTGGSGHIGASVMRALASVGADPISLSRHPVACGGRWMAVDVLDDGGAVRAVLDLEPDAVIHLAWRNGFDHASPTHMLDLSKHYAFLAGLAEAGVPRVCAMGSMHEVGYWEGAVTEETPCNPGSLYGIAKNALRAAFMETAGRCGASALWMRGFYVYGDDDGAQSVFGKLLRAARNGEGTFPFTSGANRCDFIHVDELGRQIAACALATGETGVVNCCTGRPVALGAIVEEYIEENGLGIRLEYGAYPDRPYDSPGIWGDPRRIEGIMARCGGCDEES